jgi:competence protein ComEC
LGRGPDLISPSSFPAPETSKARNGFAVAAVKPKGFDRPWSPAVVEGGDENETTLISHPVAPRAIDATPPETDQHGDE